jgi:RecJ-like exonuclease
MKFEAFHLFVSLVYYQKIQLQKTKEMNEMAAKNYENKECMYCSGKGYFQLLLGGSETCSCCGGTGKKKD